MKSIIIKVVILGICGIILYGAWKTVHPDPEENKPDAEQKEKGKDAPQSPE